MRNDTTDLNDDELVAQARSYGPEKGASAELTRRNLLASRALKQATDNAARNMIILTAALVLLTIALVIFAWQLANHH